MEKKLSLINVEWHKIYIANAERIDIKLSNGVSWCLMLWDIMGQLWSSTVCNWGGSLGNTSGVCVHIFPGSHSAEPVKHL